MAGPSTSIRRDSAASRGRQNGTESGENVIRNRNFVSKFVTPPPEGSMRDDIVIEVQKINGATFIGQLGFKEAKYGIFRDCLKLDPAMLHGIRFGFSDHPVVKFKLKEKIDVDALISIEFFTYKREFLVGNHIKVDEVDCKIRGIRAPGQTHPADSDPSIRWVKVEWSDYSLENEQMMAWLELYGTRVGELAEDIHPESDSDTSPIGSGTYSVKMRLTKDIPQLIPMNGKRIKIYYRGVQKLCTNCFGGHARLHCRNDKVRWIDYVLNFMESNPDIPEKMYGRWWQAVNEEFGRVESDREGQTGPSENTDQVVETRLERPDSVRQQKKTRSEFPEREVRIQTETRSESPQREVRRQTETEQRRDHAESSTVSKDTSTRLTREEENELADYLDLGMSLTEARSMYKKELELAEMKLRIRENKRATNRGAISTSHSRNQTRTDPWGRQSTRGGLSFN